MSLLTALSCPVSTTQFESHQINSREGTLSKSNRTDIEHRRLFVDMNNQRIGEEYNSMTDRVHLRVFLVMIIAVI